MNTADDLLVTMTLSELMPELNLSSTLADLAVSGISSDTRTIKEGDLFLAIAGAQYSARYFLDSAVKLGAKAILLDTEKTSGEQQLAGVPIIPVNNLALLASEIAGRFYAQPSRALKMVGVTGTNGKTSCVNWLAQVWTSLSIRSACLGTLGYGFMGEALTTTGMTTPDAVTNQALIARLLQRGAERLAMEVSSHAIDQHRVEALHFDVAVYTNLSRDHLDYHHSMEAYAATKTAYMTRSNIHTAVVNVDDVYGKMIAEKNRQQGKTCISYALSDESADLYCKKIQYTANGVHLALHSPWGEYTLDAPVVGAFNVQNLLAVIGASCALGEPLSSVCDALEHIKTVPGRMESICIENQMPEKSDLPNVLIDYAHTPEALKQALMALRPHVQGQLWVVFGCGGDRDQGKRKLMGSIAEAFADQVIVTSDNPRSENPEAIAQAVAMGINKKNHFDVQIDRALAIHQAISRAHADDTVLIAGKGHEDYQIIGDQRLPFSDAAAAREALLKCPQLRSVE